MKSLFLFLLITTLSVHGWAQIKITGKITDSKGEPIAGANIYIKNSYDGTSSDEKGNFNFITAESGDDTLVASYIGYETFYKPLPLNCSSFDVKIAMKDIVNELNAVVISAGSFEASDEKRLTILRPLDIVTTAGAAGDIYGALQTLPGTQQIGDETGLFVRGGDASEAKTFIDGVEVADPYYTSVPDIPQRGRFSPFLFKGTFFSTGGYSAQYGNAMSSALILDSQDLPDQTTTNIALMSVGVGIGHEHRWKNTSLGVDASYINLAPYYAIFKQRYDYNKPPESASGSLIFRQKTSKTGMLKAFINYAPSHVDISYPNLNDTSGAGIDYNVHNKNLFANASYKDLIGKQWTLFSSISYSHNNNDLLISEVPVGSINSLLQGRITLSHPIGLLSDFRFGGEAQHPWYTDHYYSNQYKQHELYTAAFFETDFYVTENLVTRIGARLEHSSFLDKTNLAPRLSIAYKTGKYSQASLAYGQFYQEPDRLFFYGTDPLKFEHADHYILNFQQVTLKQTFRIEGYYKTYHSLVKTIPDTLSSGTGYARGIDIFWRDKKTIKHADYWISYSFLDTKRDYLNYPIEATPTFAAKHTLSIVYKQTIPKINITVGATYVFATGRTYYNPNNPTFLSDKTPNYNDLSLNLSYLTTIFKNFTVIAISANNVFGFDNIYSYNYSEDGTMRSPVKAPALRSYFIGLFMSIGEDRGDDN